MGGACTSPWRSLVAPAGTPSMGWSHEGCQRGRWVQEGVIVTSHIAWEWGYAYMYKRTLLEQRILKPWWPWTYQNFAVKRASARVVLGWVTSWEVWFGGAKSEQYCVVGVGRYKWPSLQSFFLVFFFSLNIMHLCPLGWAVLLLAKSVSSLCFNNTQTNCLTKGYWLTNTFSIPQEKVGLANFEALL